MSHILYRTRCYYRPLFSVKATFRETIQLMPTPKSRGSPTLRVLYFKMFVRLSVNFALNFVCFGLLVFVLDLSDVVFILLKEVVMNDMCTEKALQLSFIKKINCTNNFILFILQLWATCYFFVFVLHLNLSVKCLDKYFVYPKMCLVCKTKQYMYVLPQFIYCLMYCIN